MMPDGQEEFDRASNVGGFSTPRPDPTILTTEQLMREISRVEGTIALHIAAVDERLTAEIRLTEQRIESAADSRGFIRKSIDDLEKNINSRFHMLEKTRAEQKEDINQAVGIARDASARALAEAIELTNAKFVASAASLDSLREMLNERYQTQTKALDAAFVAQQAAVATSFDASEKAMAAALLAAKEAVDKAAVSTEKRFDNVTELLSQQNRAMAGLLPRAESEARVTALDARLTDIKSTVDKGFTGSDTRAATGKEYWGYLVGAIGMAAVIATIVIALVGR